MENIPKIYTIAEETQLLAEEKWIIDALAKIKNQRNCLQIERLHMESLKAQLRVDSDKGHSPIPMILLGNEDSSDMPSTSTINLMQNAASGALPEYNTPFDEYCNEEVLDLEVHELGFGYNMDNAELDLEEDDEEMDNDEDVIIDMDMLMSGK